MNGDDRVKLKELMAPEFVLHKWDNTRSIARAVWFDFLFNHIKISEFEQTAIVARVYGDVGVVTSKFPITRGTFDDKPMGELHGYLMDVWRRTNGDWQVVSRTRSPWSGRRAGSNYTKEFVTVRRGRQGGSGPTGNPSTSGCAVIRDWTTGE